MLFVIAPNRKQHKRPPAIGWGKDNSKNGWPVWIPRTWMRINGSRTWSVPYIKFQFRWRTCGGGKQIKEEEAVARDWSSCVCWSRWRLNKCFSWWPCVFCTLCWLRSNASYDRTLRTYSAKSTKSLGKTKEILKYFSQTWVEQAHHTKN